MHFLNISQVVTFYILYFLYLVPQHHGISLSAVELPCNEEKECEAKFSFKRSNLRSEGSECVVHESLLVGILCQILGAQQYFDLLSDMPSGDRESNYTCAVVLAASKNNDHDPCQEKIDLIQNTLIEVSTEIALMVRDIIQAPAGFQESICRYLHDIKCLEDSISDLESDFANQYAAILKQIRQELKKYQESLALYQAKIKELEAKLTAERLRYLAAWIQSGKHGVFGEFNRLFPRNRNPMLASLINASLYEGHGMTQLTAKYMGYVATFVKTIDNTNDRWLAINQSLYTLASKKQLTSESMLILYQLAIDEFASADWMRNLLENVYKYVQSVLKKWKAGLSNGDVDQIRAITDFANSQSDQPISQKSLSTHLPSLISTVFGEPVTKYDTIFQFCVSFDYAEHKLVSFSTLKQYTPSELMFSLLLKVIETKDNLLTGSPFINSFTNLINSFPANMRRVAGDCVYVQMGWYLAGGSRGTKDYLQRAAVWSDANRRWKFEWVEDEQWTKTQVATYKFRLRNIDLINADKKHEYLGSHLNWEESSDGQGYVRLSINSEYGCWHPKHYYWHVEFLPDSDKINLYHLGMKAYFHGGLSLNLASIPSSKDWTVEECS